MEADLVFQSSVTRVILSNVHSLCLCYHMVYNYDYKSWLNDYHVNSTILWDYKSLRHGL